jgi:hypothetical protein
MAKFKHEVIRCAEKGNLKAATIFVVDESNVRLWRKHKAAMSGCEASLNAQLLQKLRGGYQLHGKPSRRALSSDLSRSALDGSEDDIAWEDDVDDKDDSDWMESMDNDLVMSDD